MTTTQTNQPIDLREVERGHEWKALAVAAAIGRLDRPSPFLVAARDAYQQAISATAMARGPVSDAQRVELLRVASAYGAAGDALSKLGGGA